MVTLESSEKYLILFKMLNNVPVFDSKAVRWRSINSYILPLPFYLLSSTWNEKNYSLSTSLYNRR